MVTDNILVLHLIIELCTVALRLSHRSVNTEKVHGDFRLNVFVYIYHPQSCPDLEKSAFVASRQIYSVMVVSHSRQSPVSGMEALGTALMSVHLFTAIQLFQYRTKAVY